MQGFNLKTRYNGAQIEFNVQLLNNFYAVRHGNRLLAILQYRERWHQFADHLPKPVLDELVIAIETRCDDFARNHHISA